MKNFVFHNPVKIIFGKGQIASLAGEIPKNAKILMTYGGGSIHRNGVYNQVKDALKNHEVYEFGGIEPNPRYETLMKALPLIKEKGIDFLLAVGGGSVIDGTKFLAAASFHEGEPWDLLARRVPVKNALPIGVVLTLPATGSEMNGGSVVSREETREKKAFGSPLLYPRFSILDPEVTFSLPERQSANGIVDAFVHTTEQYLTYPAQAPMQDRMAEAILLNLIHECPKVLTHPNDYNVRANMMWTATMALNGLIGVGVPQDWATHMIGHELTALHGLDHGLTLAIVLPGVLRVMLDEKMEKLVQYGQRVWNINGLSDKETALQAIEKTDNFFRSLGMKTRLSEHGIGEDTIREIVRRFTEPVKVNLGERGSITPEKVGEILRNRL
ncbi:MAG: NADP-dependent alcohol dehydrogenase [Bacteroidales bacterium]|jgi:NADP-dependent alcohol dehydrogenase|nr:NADP-dependent alcohol dehydrogenase [Bacteroidales bacterium]MDN5328450.1 NADP-dependent alcohol dehydrogenase [Bacteroidales bacterium]